VPDAHLCCGSAGTYSILQPAIANALRVNKLAALESGKPDVIASANIGCMMHLADGATVKVRHWIELLDSRMVGGPRSPA
jgi:glycolate oxidase iron-sulfur subunit